MIHFTPPEWEEPCTVPSTGWLSPDGVLYACAPWDHRRLAHDITRSYMRTLPEAAQRVFDCSYTLERDGWVLIGRETYSDRTARGGVFVVRCGRNVVPTEAQARVLSAWEDAGVQVVITDRSIPNAL